MGDNNTLVSIIVPVYNVERYIAETIQSVLLQTYDNWELLLVNDCSTDETLSVIKNYTDNRIHIICQKENAGAARARNRGLLEAKGRYIAFLDADDIWKSDKLVKEMAFMKEKQAAFVFTGYEFGDENAKGTGKIVHVPERLSYKEALKNTTIFTTTVMFDTKKIKKSLLKMPEVKSEDTATWWNILRCGYTAYGLNESLVIYRRPEQSLSSNKIDAVKRIWYLYRRVEKLSFFYSAYNFIFYAVRAVKRRV